MHCTISSTLSCGLHLLLLYGGNRMVHCELIMLGSHSVEVLDSACSVAIAL